MEKDLEKTKVEPGFSVEFENGILSVNENRLEFASLENMQGKLIINFGAENLYPLFDKCFRGQFPMLSRPLNSPESNWVDCFCSDEGYITSDTEFKSLGKLWNEFWLYCRQNGYILCSKDEFREILFCLGFRIGRHPKNNKLVVYCKKTKNAILEM